MNELSDDEVILSDTLLGQYVEEGAPQYRRAHYLRQWPNDSTREYLLTMMIQCDFVRVDYDFRWLINQLPMLAHDCSRVTLLREIYAELSGTENEPFWMDFQQFGFAADELCLREENDPAYLGQVLNEHRLEKRLGAGGFAVVYRATSPSGECVAIKVLRNNLEEIYEEARNDFLRETTRVATLPNKPGLPRILDTQVAAVDHGELYFSVYQFVDGISLDRWLKHHPDAVDLSWLIKFFQSVAHLLSTLHAHGLYYRDMSLSNLLLSADDSAHLIDLGLALEEHECFRAVRRAGTKNFMPPELEHRRFHGSQSDVFGLGRVLAALLIHSSNSQTPLSALSFEQLQNIVAKACHPHPRHRFDNPLQLLEALTDWCDRPTIEDYGLVPISSPPNRSISDEWQRLLEVGHNWNGLIDPTRNSSEISLNQAKDFECNETTALLQRLEVFRHGTELRIPHWPSMKDTPSMVARIFAKLATELRLKGQTRSALLFSERALRLGNECGLKEVAPDEYSIWLDDTAVLYQDHGRSREAVAAARECLRLRQQSTTCDPYFVFQAHNNLAEILRKVGHSDEVAHHSRKYRSFVRNELGTNTNSYGWALSNKSQQAIDLMQFERALPIAREALKIKERALGEDHVQLTYVQNKLGVISTALNDLSAADAYFCRAIQIRENNFGEAHIYTRRSRNLWVDSLIGRKEYRRAFKRCAEDLEMLTWDTLDVEYRRTLGTAIRLSQHLRKGFVNRRYRLRFDALKAALVGEPFPSNGDGGHPSSPSCSSNG